MLVVIYAKILNHSFILAIYGNLNQFFHGSSAKENLESYILI